MIGQKRVRAWRGKQQRKRLNKTSESGFTLLEISIALVILMFVALGAASLFAYSVNYNSASNDRAQSLAIAQLRLEQLRNTKFANLAGGTTTQYISSAGASYTTAALCQAGIAGQSGQRCYTVTAIVDDNPTTTAVDVDATRTLKKIIVKATPMGARTEWAKKVNGVDTVDTVSVVTERAKSF